MKPPFVSSQLCIHAQNGRKCQYVGNCSFAHSPEEREMWTFMKENKSEWNVGVGTVESKFPLGFSPPPPPGPFFEKKMLTVVATQ